MKRKWIIVLAAVVAALIIVVLVIPSLIDANKYRPEIESKISAALGRPVTIGNLSLSLLSMSAPCRLTITVSPAQTILLACTSIST